MVDGDRAGRLDSASTLRSNGTGQREWVIELSDNVLSIRKNVGNEVPTTTYGALTESNITALDAILSEVRRTHAHVMWLEHYVSELPDAAVFGGSEFHPAQEEQWATEGGRPKEGSIQWLLAKDIAKQMGIKPSKREPQVHMAIQQLLKERQHLVTVSQAAIRVGIALDEVEIAKQQGELLVDAMSRFAISAGLDPTDKNVVTAILDALDGAHESGAK